MGQRQGCERLSTQLPTVALAQTELIAAELVPRYLYPDLALPVQHTPGILEAGLDEAGRGCLAGPVVAGAVILPEGFHHPGLDDSKKLSHKKRMELRPIIQEHALSWAIGVLSHARIDEVNILWASFLAMHEAVAGLHIRPEGLL